MVIAGQFHEVTHVTSSPAMVKAVAQSEDIVVGRKGCGFAWDDVDEIGLHMGVFKYLGA